MAQDRFLIAPFSTGLQKNAKPFLIPEDAFQKLDNVYIKDGRIKKRSSLTYTGQGATDPKYGHLYSRLRVFLATTDGDGDVAGVVPGTIFKPGQILSCGNEIYTIPANGEPVNCLSTGSGILEIHTTGASAGNYALVDGPPTTDLFFYPSEPVLGLALLESSAINERETFAFDTQFSYKYIGNYWTAVSKTTLWTGNNKNYFYTSQFRGTTSDLTLLITSNYKYTLGLGGTFDPIRYYNPDTTLWTDYEPKTVIVSAAAPVQEYTIATAKIIVPFANSLLFFNTIEKYYDSSVPSTTLVQYKSRCRYSSREKGLDEATSFLEPNQTGWIGGGFTDANTQEEIIAVQPLKDKCIVFFERSVYLLLYTRNVLRPFRWQRLNSDFGADKTYSVIGFDNKAIAIGQNGIISCDGYNTSRVDEKIPYLSYDMSKTDATLDKVHGVIDPYEQLVYWNYIPSSDEENVTYTTKLLVYNYVNQTWSNFDDTVTSFGYAEKTDSKIWRYAFQTWREDSSTWNEGIRDKGARRLVAGNHKGFVHYLYPDANANDAALSVTGLSCAAQLLTITSQAHNLKTGNFIKIENCEGVVFDEGIYKIDSVVDADSFNIILRQLPNKTYFTGTYDGGGLLSLVSKIKIKSKEWNPYLKNGMDIHLSEINFYVTREEDSNVTVDYFINSASVSMIDQETNLGLNPTAHVLELGSYELEPFEKSQERIWHPLYFNVFANFVTIYITLTDEQMVTNGESGFELHAMLLKTEGSYGGL